VAIVGALALKWLLVRVEAAVTEIRVAVASIPEPISAAAAVVSVWNHHVLVYRAITAASRAKRGPPFYVRFSLN
jgi:hypothetical protein